jgi:hypothetical protein
MVGWPQGEVNRRRSISARQNRLYPLTGSPRCAVTPFHAVLNYLSALCESEARIALVAVGLDPSIGFLHLLHQDRANRDSLCLDIVEPIRVDCERWLYRWVTSEPLSRRDFLETSTGQVRLMSSLCSKLSETAPIWGKLLAPWAERIATRLWEGTSSRLGRRLPATPLTQANRRTVKGAPLPSVRLPKPMHVCQGCGKKIRSCRTHCLACAAPLTRGHFAKGRKLAQGPASLAQRSLSQTKHRQLIRDWKPADIPFSREFYLQR